MTEFLWGVYPYICAALFFTVPIIRMLYRPFGWSTRASGMFGRSILGAASLALHWGLFLVFAGHVAGLIGGLLGLGSWIAFFYWTGLVGGLLALAGSCVALIRRFSNPEVRSMSQPDDYIVHLFLITILGLALYQVLAHQIFGIAYNASAWFASLWAFSPQPELMASSSLITKLHVFFALTFFAYFPFTKLVHVWTYPINYASRPLQSMRTQARQFKRQWEHAMRSDQSWMVLAMVILIGGFFATAFALGDVTSEGPATASNSDGTVTDPQHGDQLTGYPLYVSQCARCHGLEGKGDGPGAQSPTFATTPRALTTGDYRFVSTKNGVASRADLRRAIREGLKGSGMPAFRQLSDRQVTSLVDVLEGFWNDRPDPGPRVEPPPRPDNTDKLVSKGKELYQNNCSSCHGEQGHGDGPAAQGLPIPPANLTTAEFKLTDSPADLYRRIAVGIPGTGMPSFSQLSDRETWALVTYLESDMLPNGWRETRSTGPEKLAVDR